MFRSFPVLWAGSGASLTFRKPQLAFGSQSKIQLFSPKEQKRSSQQFNKMVALPTLGVYSPNPHLSVPSSSVVLKSGGIKIIWEVCKKRKSPGFFPEDSHSLSLGWDPSIFILTRTSWDFLGSLVVKTPHFQRRGFNPWLGN